MLNSNRIPLEVLEPKTDGLEEVCNYDYSDAPNGSIRDWFIEKKYECEWDDPDTARFIEKDPKRLTITCVILKYS